MPQPFTDVTDSGDALPKSERRTLNALLKKLEFRTPSDAEEMRQLLVRLSSVPIGFSPPVEDLQSRVRDAIFWRDCRDTRILSCTETHTIPQDDWLDRDFIQWSRSDIGQLHTVSGSFWEVATELVDDPFLKRMAWKVGNDFEMGGIRSPSLRRATEFVVLSCLDFALASHLDGVLFRKGRRFDAFFRLAFDGNLVIGFDRGRHEALVLVAPH